MPLEKVKISNPSFTEYNNAKGKSFLIKFTQFLPEGDRKISGFAPANKLNRDDWKDGVVKELDISQNEKGFWNFKLSYQANKQPAQESQTQKDILSCLLRIESLLQKDKISIEHTKQFFGAKEEKNIFDIEDEIPDPTY